MAGNRIMMIAGEASGDLYGGKLAAEIRRLRPDVELFGMGGSGMRKAGVNTLVDCADVAVMGVWEVLAHLKEIKGVFDRMKRIIEVDPPTLLVLIDYPDFNLRLAKVAKKAGVPVLYYISPKVWAWRRGRVRKIAARVDRMLLVFPFEGEAYKGSGLECVFVGHPLLDDPYDPPERAGAAARYGLDPKRPILGLLPGSRRKEIAYLLPVMLGAYRLLKEKMPELQAIIPVAETLDREVLAPHLSGYDDIVAVEHDTPGVMGLMDAAVVASGTATLQAALHRKPMVIVYRLSPPTYLIGKMLLNIKYIGLVNLVAEELVVPELIQDMANPEEISALIFKMFYDKAYSAGIVEKLDAVRARLGGPGASRRAAEEAVRFLA